MAAQSVTTFGAAPVWAGLANDAIAWRSRLSSLGIGASAHPAMSRPAQLIAYLLVIELCDIASPPHQTGPPTPSMATGTARFVRTGRSVFDSLISLHTLRARYRAG